MTDQWDNNYLFQTGKLHTNWINDNPVEHWVDPRPNTFPFSPPVGWQCPICGQVYAPSILTCFKKHRKPRKPKADGEAS